MWKEFSKIGGGRNQPEADMASCSRCPMIAGQERADGCHSLRVAQMSHKRALQSFTAVNRSCANSPGLPFVTTSAKGKIVSNTVARTVYQMPP
jgi:hypothetical protein